MGFGQGDIDAFVAECGLRLVVDAEKGQRTVAARDFRRGDTLLTIRPLYGFPVRKGEEEGQEEPKDAANSTQQTVEVELEDRCASCFERLPPKRPQCSQCHATQYCSTSCLAEHWAARHHFECKSLGVRAMGNMASRIKPMYRPYLRMAVGVGKAIAEVARRIRRAEQLGKPAERSIPRWLRLQAAAWERLVDHCEAHPPHVLKQYREIAGVVAEAQEAATEDDSLVFSIADTADTALANSTVRALCRFGCNNFVAYDQRMRASGHLCSPLVSLLFNHSCFQNAAFVYTRGGQQVVLALDDIREGEEVTLSYADGLRPRSERRKALEAVYFFECQCQRCVGDSPRAQLDALLDRASSVNAQQRGVPHNLPTDFARQPSVEPWVQQIISTLADVVLGGSSEEGFAQTCLGLVKAMPPEELSFAAYRHWLVCQDECLDKLVSGGESAASMWWDWACVSSLYVLAFYAMVYPPFHPLVGLQCLESAKLAWNSIQASSLLSLSAEGWRGLLLTEGFVRNLAQAAQVILELSDDPDSSSASAAEKQIALLLSQIDGM
ncbi:hypothetical protein GQ54DRAFT_312214 [Martensiomyces pterosporus]|nr:hypothetical protein GQ54DRAFT_312214 [Martensiomyces pterosporus]